MPGFLYCGLCRFYFSRITHAVATTALVGMVGSGVSLFFTDDLARLRLAALPVRTVSLVLSVMATATFRRAATSTPGAIPPWTKDEWAAPCGTQLLGKLFV